MFQSLTLSSQSMFTFFQRSGTKAMSPRRRPFRTSSARGLILSHHWGKIAYSMGVPQREQVARAMV